MTTRKDTYLEGKQCVRVYQAVDGTERLRGARTCASPVKDGGTGRAVRPDFAAPAAPRASVVMTWVKVMTICSSHDPRGQVKGS